MPCQIGLPVYNKYGFGQPAQANKNREEIFTMKSIVKATAAVFLTLVIFASCNSNPRVSRIDLDEDIDLSGNWSDGDVRRVCDSLIKDCLEDPQIAQEIERRGGIPTVLVLEFANDSDEHIDTSIITGNMESAIFRSRKLTFVAGGGLRDKIRAERQDQLANASEETAAALGKEVGADFVLTGSVKTQSDRQGGRATRTYYVSARITNVDTGLPLWMPEPAVIRKYIETPRAKL
jgi:PBP1b-binding outer membrane lipoprotein LpoB